MPAQAIRLFGTDFSLMERMFPGRQRRALRNKLAREYRADGPRVDAALSGGGAEPSAALDKLKEVAGMLRQVSLFRLLWPMYGLPLSLHGCMHAAQGARLPALLLPMLVVCPPLLLHKVRPSLRCQGPCLVLATLHTCNAYMRQGLTAKAVAWSALVYFTCMPACMLRMM